MKNRKLVFLTSLLAVSCLTACGGGNNSSNNSSKLGPTEITLPEADETREFDNTPEELPDEILMNHRLTAVLVDEEQQLRPLEQFKYDGSNLQYESKNPEIATVSETGLIKGVAAGKTEIFVSDKDHPDLNVTIPVTVNAEIDEDQASELATALSKVDESGYTRIVDNELYEKSVYKNDELVSYDRYDQRMVGSIDDGYFRIWETDAEIITKGGAMNFTNYEWVFYTNSFFDTYIYHQTGDVKNYLRVPTQSYMDGDRIAPVNEILDNLFTSGHEIFDNMFDSAKLSKFTDMITADYNNVTDKLIGSNEEGQCLFCCTIIFNNEAADQDDETRYGIPFGTPMPSTQAMRYIVEDNKLVAYSVHLESLYDIGEDHYKAVYEIDHSYEEFTQDSLYVPDRKQYNQVDSIFDV